MKQILMLIVVFNCFSMKAQKTNKFSIEKPDDFAYHVWAGMAINIGVGTATYYKTKNVFKACFIGWSAAVLAGGVKEVVHDKLMHRGVPTLKDFLATAWGATVSFPIVRCGIDMHESRKLEREYFEHYGDSLQFQRSCDTLNLPTHIKLD